MRSTQRAARRVENYCRRQVPDCRVVTVIDGDDKSIGLRVGPRGGGRTEQLWVRDLEPTTLARREDVENLARLIRVWIEPDETDSSVERPAVRPARAAAH